MKVRRRRRVDLKKECRDLNGKQRAALDRIADEAREKEETLRNIMWGGSKFQHFSTRNK